MSKQPYKNLLKQTGYKFKLIATSSVDFKFIFEEKQIALAFIKSIAKAIYAHTGYLPYIFAQYKSNGGLITASYKFNKKMKTEPQIPHQSPHNLNDNAGQRKQRKVRAKIKKTE